MACDNSALRYAEKLVVTLTDVRPKDFIQLLSPLKGGRSLSAFRINPNVYDLDTLVNALWDLYGQFISNGCFLYEGGQWRPFNEMSTNGSTTS